jgi:PPM family protein phosphatase
VVAGRASIVGAAATHVGKVREHNEDAHFLDVDLGMFLVCDGMGGHAAGEVASAIAIRSICHEWASAGLRDVAEQWLDRGTPAAKKQLLDVVRAGVVAAHAAILAEAERDESKSGMGTTLVGAMVIGGELVFAHAGDSRAYLVRDGISMQLTEDHTLLARLLAAGIDVDVSGEGARFRSMLTNALGIGDEVKVSTFVVPLADGDRFLLCSDGISEYVPENEVGDVLSRQSSPARAAQKLIDLALERGGGDNATAVVVRVLEAGETPLPAEQRKKDDAAIGACALWGSRVTPQQRLRALRIAIPRDHGAGDKLPPHTLGDRVAWIVVEGELVQDGVKLGPGALVYPESLVTSGEPAALPDRDALAVARSEVRALAIRADDFRELCDDDGELGEALLESLGQVIARKQAMRGAARASGPPVDPRGNTDPHLRAVDRSDAADGYHATDPSMPVVDEPGARDRAATVPDEPSRSSRWPRPESPIIAPVAHAPARPSPLPPQLAKRVAPPAPAPTRPSPLPAQLSPRTPPVAQPPSRPSPPPAPRARSVPPRMTSPTPQPAAVPNQAVTPAAVTAAPRAAPNPQPRKTPAAGVPARSTPVGGVRPLGQPAAPKPAAPKPAASADGEADTTELPVRAESPWDTTTDWDERTERMERRDHAWPGDAAATTMPKGFAPALAPPTGNSAPARASRPSPAPAVSSRHGDTAGGRAHYRPPTEPEIETYLELEAELPPESGGGPDLEAAFAFGPAARSAREELDEEHASVSITIEDDRTRVTETVTETSFHTLTVTVTEPVPAIARPRRITAEDALAVSGTIDDGPPPDALPPRRAKRHSEGWDD